MSICQSLENRRIFFENSRLWIELIRVLPNLKQCCKQLPVAKTSGTKPFLHFETLIPFWNLIFVSQISKKISLYIKPTVYTFFSGNVILFLRTVCSRCRSESIKATKPTISKLHEFIVKPFIKLIKVNFWYERRAVVWWD